ncbi:hypothetical protein [Flindersiella endophytica]
MVEDAGGTFVLVHLATPIEACELRREEQYALARAGKLRVFTACPNRRRSRPTRSSPSTPLRSRSSPRRSGCSRRWPRRDC